MMLNLEKELKQYVRDNYDRGKYFSTHALVSDFLIEKGYRLNMLTSEQRQIRRKLTSRVVPIIKKLLNEGKIVRHSSSTYRAL